MNLLVLREVVGVAGLVVALVALEGLLFQVDDVHVVRQLLFLAAVVRALVADEFLEHALPVFGRLVLGHPVAAVRLEGALLALFQLARGPRFRHGEPDKLQRVVVGPILGTWKKDSLIKVKLGSVASGAEVAIRHRVSND